MFVSSVRSKDMFTGQCRRWSTGDSQMFEVAHSVYDILFVKNLPSISNGTNIMFDASFAGCLVVTVVAMPWLCLSDASYIDMSDHGKT
jgi:hypothetical protein